MGPISKKPSLSDVQDRRPHEFSDHDYDREVLQLEEGTEQEWDEVIVSKATALGVEVSRPQKGHISVCDSSETVVSGHARTGSTGSNASIATSITSRSSTELDTIPASKRKSSRRSLSFSEYESFLLQVEGHSMPFKPTPPEPAPSLFSVSTQKSFTKIKASLKNFRLRRSKISMENLTSCICCRDDFKKNKTLHHLPCSHKYCDKCLRVLVEQASSDESRMPPKCCSRAIPGMTVKAVLSREEQAVFIKSVLQFSTPWESRIFCPNPACGDFIPKQRKIDPKHPFEVTCKKCRTKACSICKRGAHMIGQDCPSDWELEEVLRMGENQGWRRCYKCRSLVELMHGCSHITCRCKAQFCYICGAVWDPSVGCPNYCNGEEELERRRIEEEARIASQAAEKALQEAAEAATATVVLEATKRTDESEELNELRARQINDRDRFNAFERKMKWVMWTRHGQLKLDVMERYADLQTKMKDRHSKTSAHLEDRQVTAEMDLRATLKQMERSVRIRLRHMEAYCDGLGLGANGPHPARVVTERDLRELGQQYNVRDDMERLHQSRINVMRDKQSKQMEQLLLRQEEEVEKLAKKQKEELSALAEIFSVEEEKFHNIFAERKTRMKRRWRIMSDIERKRLEVKTNLVYAPMKEVEWPDVERRPEGLEAVTEEAAIA